MRSPSILHTGCRLAVGIVAWMLLQPAPVTAAVCSSPADAVLDTDGDGTCDLDDPVDAPANVVKMRIKRSVHLGDPMTNGSILAFGDFTFVSPSDGFDPAKGMAVHVVDSYLPPVGPLDVRTTWDGGECLMVKGQVRCANADRSQTATFKMVTRSPGVVRFVIRLKHLDIAAPFLEPVTVTITTNGVTDRVDVATECRASVSGLLCKKL